MLVPWWELLDAHHQQTCKHQLLVGHPSSILTPKAKTGHNLDQANLSEWNPTERGSLLCHRSQYQCSCDLLCTPPQQPDPSGKSYMEKVSSPCHYDQSEQFWRVPFHQVHRWDLNQHQYKAQLSDATDSSRSNHPRLDQPYKNLDPSP